MNKSRFALVAGLLVGATTTYSSFMLLSPFLPFNHALSLTVLIGSLGTSLTKDGLNGELVKGLPISIATALFLAALAPGISRSLSFT
jgi:hypothetical protein